MAISIHEIPEKQRYWVVRAEAGLYLNNFRQGTVIAIGHLNLLRLPNSGDVVFAPELDRLEKTMAKIYESEDRPKGTLTSHIHQVRDFVEEMNIGDLVLTPTKNEILVGRITGAPRINNSTISVRRSSKTDEFIDLDYSLRRKVSWMRPIRRNNFPIAIAKSLRANQTVFNIDDHWRALHHLIYPFFSKNDQIYSSIRIEQTSQIDNYSVSRLLTFISEAEVYSRYFDELDPEDENRFAQFMSNAIANNQLSLSTQAQFMSDGDIWTLLTKLKKPASYVNILLIYGMIFGNDVLGMDGILDKEARHKIFSVIKKEWFSKGGDQINKRLILKLPNHDTRNLEDNSSDEDHS